MGNSKRFLDGKRVQIGAQQQRFAAVDTANDCQHTVPPKLCFESIDAKSNKCFLHKVRCMLLDLTESAPMSNLLW